MDTARSGGQKARQASYKGGIDECPVNADSTNHPPSLNEPQAGDDFAAYRDPHCFAYDKGSDPNQYEWSTLKRRSPGNVPMWIMSEVRMRHTRPTQDAAQGKGMVVGMVRNNDSTAAYSDTAWHGKSLGPMHDALIWLGRDTTQAVLFTYDEQNHVVILATSNWIPGHRNISPPYPTHAQALWNHPPGSADTTAATMGIGWIACIDGCCTPGHLFTAQQ